MVEPDWETAVIAGADDDLSAAIWSAHLHRNRNPRIGRALAGSLASRGFDQIAVDVCGMAIRTWTDADQAFGLTSAAHHAAQVGLVTDTTAERWIADLIAASDHGNFLAAVTCFWATGSTQSD